MLKSLLINHNIKASKYFRYFLDLSDFSSWVKTVPRTSKFPNFFNDRTEMYRFVKTTLLGCDTPMDFLEFGVYEGSSFKTWLKLDSHPESRFYGFDSFEGLPEDWEMPTATLKKGTFDLKGAPPVLSDPRGRFIVGRFQKTLRDFLKSYQPQNQLIVHLDADLYSSTLFVLTQLDPLLKPGTLILFDEFSSVSNEFRAWQDYSRGFEKRAELVAATQKTFDQVVLRVLP